MLGMELLPEKMTVLISKIPGCPYKGKLTLVFAFFINTGKTGL